MVPANTQTHTQKNAKMQKREHEIKFHLKLQNCAVNRSWKARLHGADTHLPHVVDYSEIFRLERDEWDPTEEIARDWDPAPKGTDLTKLESRASRRVRVRRRCRKPNETR